jgi:molybdopterin-guanine dinucleotide biosynthesis protein B
MLLNAHIPIIGFAAWSGTGKTTLLRRLLPLLRDGGLRVGVVKHAHHDFEIDQQGKDSYELRQAGASQTLVASRRRWALMVERELDREPTLDEVLLDLDQALLDLIVVEGFKREVFAKIELHRIDRRAPLLYQTDTNIVAIATDGALTPTPTVPVLDLNDPSAVAAFVFSNIVGSSHRSSNIPHSSGA